MLKTMLLAAAPAGFLAFGLLPLDFLPAQAEQMTCRQAAKAKFPGRLEEPQCLPEGLQGRVEGKAQPAAASAESLKDARTGAWLGPRPSPCRATQQSSNQH